MNKPMVITLPPFTEPQVDLIITSLDYFKNRLDYSDSRTDFEPHKRAALYTKRRIDEVLAMIQECL